MGIGLDMEIFGDFWRFLEIFGAVVYPKKRQGRKTPTYHDI
jgi:hypothetical protein